MEQARWDQIEELLQAALDVDPARRAAFLREACNGDEQLALEVEALLAADAGGDLLESTAIAGLTLTGRTISHYRIEARIGAGGMGEVYRARDETLQRIVALKALPLVFTADPERVRRFEQEALAASRLNHPNIITIFEIVRSEGEHFIATELVEGSTLRALLDGGTFEVDRALDIAIQIAAALDAAHTAWIIHRDVKPENVMVRGDRLVKVLDFGIAKLSEEPAEAARSTPASISPSNLTMPGAVLGTASYMSPEQVRGEPLDARTDLYSLGLVMREMVAEPPRELQRIIQKLLRPNREERYPSAAALLVELRAFQRRLESRTARRLVGISALVVIAALVVTAAAAMLSVHETWQERVLRDGHTAAARRAVFSPDGRLLVTCGEDDQILVWDFARRERMATIPAPARHLAFSPNGRWFASGAIDGTVTIWDAESFQRLRALRVEGGEIGALEFSPDARMLAAATTTPPQGRTTVWNTARWNEVGQWPRASSYGTFAFLDDGRRLLSSTSLTTLDLEDGGLDSGREPLMSANWLALSAGRNHLVTVSSMGEVSFYALPEWRLLSRHRAHRDHGRSIAVSPDGRFVASASEDIVLWDAAAQTKIARFEHSAIVWSVAFSPDGRWLVSTHGDGAVLVWDIVERERVANLNEHSAAVRAVSFSPDGRSIASAGEDRSVTIWDSSLGRKQAVLAGHDTRVMSLSFSADGGTFASQDQDGTVILWDVARRKPRLSIRPQNPMAAYCVAVSPDGNSIANFRGLFDTSDGRMVASFEGWTFNHPYGAVFSRDGRLFAAATPAGWVLLWDVERRRMREQQQISGALIAIAFSPDGKWLATGEDEGVVRLWSVRPLRNVAILGRHTARVKSVAFSPDGETVASAGDDRMIALWDVKRRKLRATVGTHASPVYSVAFSPDGRRLVSGEHDHSVRVYTRKRSLWGYSLE
ncbi:MAG TPA: serine/threonine-protein kinase [Thermoanaerobaculia bacterium]|jgi:WD40 repeat protein|nr:serine/threonine-protein kinase [Thermoanaerobaculia bacterium]